MTDSPLTDSKSADTALQYLSAKPEHSISSPKKEEKKRCQRSKLQSLINLYSVVFDKTVTITVKKLYFFSHPDTPVFHL